MENEEWRTIERFNHKFAVSNFYRFKNMNTNNILKPSCTHSYSVYYKKKRYGLNALREFNELFPELPKVSLRSLPNPNKPKRNSVKRFDKLHIDIKKDDIIEKTKDNYIIIDRIKMLIKELILTKTDKNSIVTIDLDKDIYKTINLRLDVEDTKIVNTALYELFKSRNKKKITIKHLNSTDLTKIYYEN